MPRRVVKGGNKTLKREVTPEEVEKNRRSAKDHWVWKRAEIIQLAAAGYNNLEIEEITGINSMRKMSGYGLTGLTPKGLRDCTGEKVEKERESCPNSK